MTDASGSEAGFSLLETLLGLALTGMIAALMMGSMQMGVRVWERDSAGAQPGEDQLLLSQTGEWIAQAMPANLRSREEPAFVPFAGSEHSISFLYPAPGLGASPGVYAIDLELVPADDCRQGRRLMMRIARTEPVETVRPTRPSRAEERQLAACLPAPSFAFWGATLDEPAAAWRRDWNGQLALPTVVRLTSASAGGAEQAVLTQRLVNARLP